MRIVLQRVRSAAVRVDGQITGKINQGLLVLVGIEDADQEEDIHWLTNKILQLRIFDDANKVMNLCLKEVGGELLVVSQFTLHASTKKGNRPSYSRAAKPEQALVLYEKMLRHLESEFGKKVQAGIFGADMQVELVNDGPVTLVIDSKNKE